MAARGWHEQPVLVVTVNGTTGRPRAVKVDISCFR
jgi:hypothetical protein